MQKKDENRIIRIQDIQSNYIEEMIVILKNNAYEISFIIQEAESIIDDYIAREEKGRKKNLLKSSKKDRIDLNKILNYLLVLGVVFVMYVVRILTR